MKSRCLENMDLNRVRDEMKAEVPDPLHNALEMQSRKEEAMEKLRARKKKKTNICPPTCSETKLQSLMQPQTENQDARQVKPPCCKTCGKRFKVNKRGQCSA